ncbi:M14-type cytosolic carboxypeptidase [Marinibactrum halimedae]|nr:M14-type cytosolic carboxypeptidase [Marinibactrum halimedae]MCD9461010.1 M14-type cytosolic carboxypeptidase [Marinibactrum halimedae]
MALRISSMFDGGNIHCVQCSEKGDIQLEIEKDHNSEFLQWFYFRLTGAAGLPCHIQIGNAGAAAYPKGFHEYCVVASYDRRHWFRIGTEFDGQTLSFQYTPNNDALYFAYFVPYSLERHADLIAQYSSVENVQYEMIGQTVDGRDLDLLKIASPQQDHTSATLLDKLSFWVIGRQHPGETMAEWWMEGFLQRLLDVNDPVSRALLRHVDVYVVPNMNPDGSYRGHLRTNAAGRNLNREWLSPSETHSPEVFYTLKKMRATNVNFCLDVHGDEALPYNFIAGPEGIPSWSDQRQADLDFYKNALMMASPDFQTQFGYPVPAPGKANPTICTNFIAEEFKCLAMTLEMPFKDTVETPMRECGWSPERSQRLGAANVDAMYRFCLRLMEC